MRCTWLLCVTIACAVTLISAASVAESDTAVARIAGAGSVADRLLALGLTRLGSPSVRPHLQSIVPAQDTPVYCRDPKYSCCCLWADLDAADCVDPSVCAAHSGKCVTETRLPLTSQSKNNCPLQ
jgi:hypothetical protein